MSAYPSVTPSLEHAAVFIQQFQLVFQTQFFDVFGELVKEQRNVGWFLPYLLFENIVHHFGHE